MATTELANLSHVHAQSEEFVKQFVAIQTD